MGLLLMLYPAISNVYNEYKQGEVITHYDETIDKMNELHLSELREQARAYNRKLIGNVKITDPFDAKRDAQLETEYENILNVDGKGTIGTIVIPKINVQLPIYHGTGEDALAKGAGHLEHTSFPVGDEGSHAIISAHTGLPSAKLFNDLDQLALNDIFYLHVLDDELAYKVVDIQIVKPTETHALKIDFSQDMVTLVTCTPYGINSHRLLVRGVRSQHTKSETSSQQLFMPKNWLETYADALVVGVIGTSLLLGVIYIRKRRKKDPS